MFNFFLGLCFPAAGGMMGTDLGTAEQPAVICTKTTLTSDIICVVAFLGGGEWGGVRMMCPPQRGHGGRRPSRSCLCIAFHANVNTEHVSLLFSEHTIAEGAVPRCRYRDTGHGPSALIGGV